MKLNNKFVCILLTICLVIGTNGGNSSGKLIYFWKEYFLTNLMVIVILFQQSHFVHKINSNLLPFEHVVLGANEKL